MTALNCPLCKGLEVSELHSYMQKFRSQVFERRYLLCSSCGLVFLAPDFRVSAEFEMERYQEHENDITQKGYREFLGKLWSPLKQRLKPGSCGLDFGSGPGPAAAVLAREAGFSIELFDLFFANNPSVLQKSYDFVLCTEVVEHFSEPFNEWTVMSSLIEPGGWLGVMTDVLISLEQFPSWHYHRDLTHVSFYQEKTMLWIGEKFGFDVEFLSSRVILFHKK